MLAHYRPHPLAASVDISRLKQEMLARVGLVVVLVVLLAAMEVLTKGQVVVVDQAALAVTPQAQVVLRVQVAMEEPQVLSV